TGPAAFGLEQRATDFADYQDPEAQYERRPSVIVEPIGNWGPGYVRLAEIPADLEIYDNVVAFWTPLEQPQAGETRRYDYRMRWGAPYPRDDENRARVIDTRV